MGWGISPAFLFSCGNIGNIFRRTAAFDCGIIMLNEPLLDCVRKNKIQGGTICRKGNQLICI